MKILAAMGSLAVIMTASSVGASCPDIREDCSRAYQLDKARCADVIDDQANACRQRALEQYKYCIKASGC